MARALKNFPRNRRYLVILVIAIFYFLYLKSERIKFISFMVYRGHSIFEYSKDELAVFGSCTNAGNEYKKKTNEQSCNDLVLAAAERGRSASMRGRTILWGMASIPVLDGCTMAYGGRNGSFDFSTKEPSSSGLKADAPPIDPACKLTWITYSTGCSVNLNRIADICDIMGIEFLLLGLNEEWVGFGGRARKIREAITSLPPDRVVFGSDAEDVFLLPTKACSLQGIFQRLASIGRPVVICAERYCYPDGHLWSTYPQPPEETPFLYLNAGTYLGYAWALSDVIAAAYRGDCIDDQRELTRVFLAETSYVGVPSLRGKRKIIDKSSVGFNDASGLQNKYIHLDWMNVVLSSLAGSEMSEFDFSSLAVEGSVMNKITGGCPCFLHQNGDKAETPEHPVIWQRFIKEAKIDELRAERGYLRSNK